MAQNTYGVSVNGAYVDVSATERGAKCYATRNGFSEVYIRFNCGYTVVLVATKTSSGVWQSARSGEKAAGSDA